MSYKAISGADVLRLIANGNTGDLWFSRNAAVTTDERDWNPFSMSSMGLWTVGEILNERSVWKFAVKEIEQ